MKGPAIYFCLAFCLLFGAVRASGQAEAQVSQMETLNGSGWLAIKITCDAYGSWDDGRVAPVPMTMSTPAEGAPGPSRLGTGDGGEQPSLRGAARDAAGRPILSALLAERVGSFGLHGSAWLGTQRPPPGAGGKAVC